MINLKITNTSSGLKLENLSKSIQNEIEQIMKEVSVELNRELKKTLSTAYVSPQDSSKPYTPPHMRTGNLRSAISAEIVQTSQGKTIIRAGDLYAKADYAKLLEHGTNKTLPRPFLTPLTKKYFQILKQKLLNILKD